MNKPHFVSEHLSWIYLLAFINSATMNICVQVFVLPYIFITFVSCIIGMEFFSQRAVLFNFLSNLQTVFQSSNTILHFYKQYIWVAITSHPH